MSNDALDPTLDDLLRLTAKVHGKEQTYTDLPAKVLTYDGLTQTVNVQILVLVPRNGKLRSVGSLQQLQVRWPAGATWSIVGDLTPATPTTGTPGWVRFAGADISAWKMQGTERDPTALLRQGSKSDAYFEPGGQPISAPLDALAWKAGALVIRAAELLLGDSTATDKVALDSLVRAAIQVVYNAHDSHVHLDPVAGTTGVPTVLFAPAVPANVGATKVKAI